MEDAEAPKAAAVRARAPRQPAIGGPARRVLIGMLSWREKDLMMLLLGKEDVEAWLRTLPIANRK